MAKVRRRKYDESVPESGRPTIYRPDTHIPKIRQFALLGLNNKQIAEAMGIHEQTFYLWLRQYPYLKKALEEGQVAADSVVAEALFKRAIGYSHPEEKIFSHPANEYQSARVVRVRTRKHYPPDTPAAIRWLAARQGDKWKEVTTHRMGGDPDGSPIGVRDETKQEVIASILNMISPKPNPRSDA